MRKNVSSQSITFCLTKASDGSALTGATVSVYVTRDNGTQAAGAGTVSEKGNGQYAYAPTQGETNANSVGFLFTASTALPVNVHLFPTAYDPTDATRLGLSALPSAAAGASGGLPTLDANSRVPAEVADKTGFGLTTAERGSIADAVWDETYVGHSTANSYGLFLDLQLSYLESVIADLPTAADNADAVWNEARSGHTTAGTFGEGVPTLLGPGATAFTYTLTSAADATHIAEAQVWVTTDAAGTRVVASGITDAFGQVTFYLDPGTYYVWRQKAGWTFANPDTEVVA